MNAGAYRSIVKIQKYVDKKNKNLYNKNHVNELSLYHDKAIRDKRRAIYTGGR